MLGALKPRSAAPARGFTLIELGLVAAVTAVLIVIAAPSLADFIRLQRLKGVNAQLVTDLQFARSQALARRQYVAVEFHSNETLTCYTIYAPASKTDFCDCRSGAGAACPAGLDEIRTVVVPRTDSVEIFPFAATEPAFAYDYIVGGLMNIPLDLPWEPLGSYAVQASLDSSRVLRTTVGAAGRVSVCAPSSTSVGAPRCE